MIAAASASPQGPAVPRTIYRCNVERIRRDFSRIYPELQEDIRAGRTLIVEGP